ncbi:phage major capsid protein [Psychrobacter sp. M9-54-1]|uniref:phage major capsid protein n=1 Tax=Psychrobacter sp. M9-54-1 TaxID=2782386 RepID=UPI00190AB17F|nr:phage major capsid protein [Psychrobacter sp. M9-54-1]MBK3393735.1 phage major capsid protein [Psychrobacter sp. M9-54-1]
MWEKQRAQLLATIKSKKGKVQNIMKKAADDDRTADDGEEDEIAVLEAEIARLETNLVRVEGFIDDAKNALNDATPAAGENEEEAAASAEGEADPAESAKGVSAVKPNHAKKGIGFAQLTKAKALAVLQQKNGNYVSPLAIAKSQGMDPRVIQALEKAAAVLDTSNSSALIVENQLANEFIEMLRAETIVDKLSSQMRAAPFNATIPGMATGGIAAWVGEGEAKPATNPTFNTVEIKHHKLAGIVVRTDDLLKLSTPGTDQMLRDDMIEACAALIDNTFIDTGAQTTKRPAGVLNGATKIDHTGTTVNNYKADLAALRAAFISNSLSLKGACYVMSETRASDISELTDALGNPYYRGMDAPFGEKTLKGLKVIESETAADVIALIKPSELYLADDGAVEIAFSDQATINMGTDAEQLLVNLWQQNMTAIRAERHITWAKRRVTAAAYIDYTNVIP